jgi:predicted site-specific integrase-resolvase
MNAKVISSPEIRLLLSAKEVAAILNIGLSTVYAYADMGFLPVIHLPRIRESHAIQHNRRACRFHVDDVRALVDNLKQASSLNKSFKGGEN